MLSSASWIASRRLTLLHSSALQKISSNIRLFVDKQIHWGYTQQLRHVSDGFCETVISQQKQKPCKNLARRQLSCKMGRLQDYMFSLQDSCKILQEPYKIAAIHLFITRAVLIYSICIRLE